MKKILILLAVSCLFFGCTQVTNVTQVASDELKYPDTFEILSQFEEADIGLENTSTPKYYNTKFTRLEGTTGIIGVWQRKNGHVTYTVHYNANGTYQFDYEELLDDSSSEHWLYSYSYVGLYLLYKDSEGNFIIDRTYYDNNNRYYKHDYSAYMVDDTNLYFTYF